MKIQKYYLALDLKENPELVNEYKVYHKKVWPEIITSIKDSGILNMNIFCLGNRLFMVIEANDDFSFEKKSEMDATNPKVVEWEELMLQFQQPLPWAKEGEKWMLMENIFEL